MMYNNKLVVCLKSAGKVLRELKDTVYLPFGSEYSILIKNLNTVRASIVIDIDGTRVNESSLVIMPGQEVELERFIKDGNLDKGNRFKFIERTSRIEDHRGIMVDDGIVRVEFQFERELSKPVYYPMFYPNPEYYGGYAPSKHSVLRSTFDVSRSASVASTNNAITQNMVYDSAQVNDAGITVPGSVSDQKFKTVDWFPLLDEKHVIVLKLLGETASGKSVTKPITVKTKQKCPTCGHMNKATAKFCVECGTGLEIV